MPKVVNVVTLQQYQGAALRTAPQDWNKQKLLTYAALGIVGEAAEVSEKLKKVLYHNHELPSNDILEELGDTLWYIALIASALGYTLQDVAYNNIKKLQKRYPEGYDPERSRNR